MANANPAPPTRIGTTRLQRLVEFVALGIVAIVAVNVLVELAARITLTHATEEQIVRLQKELSDASNPSRGTANDDDLKSKRKSLEDTYSVKEAVFDLIYDGTAGRTGTLEHLRAALRGARGGALPESQNESMASSASRRYVSEFLDLLWVLINAPRKFIATASSEWLLALLVMAFGMVGGQAAGFFTPGLTLGNDIQKGFISGLCTYLIVRSGRHLFISQIETTYIYLNPFSLAVLAFMTGLFADSIFPYVRHLVVRSAARFAKEAEKSEKGQHHP